MYMCICLSVLCMYVNILMYTYRVFIGSAETGLTDTRAKGSRHALSRRMASTERGVRCGVEADVAAR